MALQLPTSLLLSRLFTESVLFVQASLYLQRSAVFPRPDVQVRGNGTAVVSDLRYDVSRLHTLTLRHDDFSYVYEGDDHAVLVLEVNLPVLGFPV